MPFSTCLLEPSSCTPSGFSVWYHRKHQILTQLSNLYEPNHPALLDNLDNKEWSDFSRNSTINGSMSKFFQKRTHFAFAYIQNQTQTCSMSKFFQKRTHFAFASSQNQTQTCSGRMDKLLWLILVIVCILFLPIFVSWVPFVKTIFSLCFYINIISRGLEPLLLHKKQYYFPLETFSLNSIKIMIRCGHTNRL